MATSDGNGWVECRCGARHWGRFGAAGLLLCATEQSPMDCGDQWPADAQVLLQHRAQWSHQGGTWGIPGGARDSHEDVVTSALREAWEETGIDASEAGLRGMYRDDHGSWSYTTVMMTLDSRPSTRMNPESLELRWVPIAEVPELPLHPGFAAAWPRLSGPQRRLVVDVANVMGSRPDGWWRDRAGAAQRIVDSLGALVGTVTTAEGALITLVHAVVEGQARHSRSADPGVLVTAAGTADEWIASHVGSADLVVTADAQLRQRARDRGAEVVGPRWLLDLMDGPG